VTTPSRRVAIIQSCYIPWRGYFTVIERCQAFVFLDSVQFTRRDWRTRNAIKTSTGRLWLSVPVKQKGNSRASIDAIEIADPDWNRRHLRSIEVAYSRASAYDAVFPALVEMFHAVEAISSLSALNQHLTRAICGLLEIKTPLFRDIDLLPRARLEAMNPTERLVNLTKAADGSEYLSGPSARNYLDEGAFRAAGLTVAWMDYSACIIPYPQLWNGFEPAVSIVDPLLNLGCDATSARIADRPNAAAGG
jgi:WbqC-like protein family